MHSELIAQGMAWHTAKMNENGVCLGQSIMYVAKEMPCVHCILAGRCAAIVAWHRAFFFNDVSSEVSIYTKEKKGKKNNQFEFLGCNTPLLLSPRKIPSPA